MSNIVVKTALALAEMDIRLARRLYGVTLDARTLRRAISACTASKVLRSTMPS